jgi:hypothetical protein
VWFSNSVSVTRCQAAGNAGRTPPTVDVRASLPRATSASAVAALNALATLARRVWAVAVGAADEPISATPAVYTFGPPDRSTTTITPGAPSGPVTSRAMARTS